MSSKSRCGKRKNPQFPFTTDELKKKLLDNVDRMKSPKTKTEIRKMSREDLCKYFATKNNKKLKFNIRLIKKKDEVEIEKPEHKKRSRSKSPAKRKTKSKSPAKRKTKSKSPAKRKSKSKSPAKRKSKSKSPMKRKTKSKSPAKKHKKVKRTKKSQKKNEFIEKEGLLYDEEGEFYAILNKKGKFPTLTGLKEKDVSRAKDDVTNQDFLVVLLLIMINDEISIPFDDVNITAFPQGKDNAIIIGDMIEEITKDKQYIKDAIIEAAKEKDYRVDTKSITIKGFKFEDEPEMNGRRKLARLIIQVKGKKIE